MHFTFGIKAFSLFTQHSTPVKALPADLREAAGESGKGRVYLKDGGPEVTGADEVHHHVASPIPPAQPDDPTRTI